MARLSNPDHFDTILEFAAGIADRGIPMSLVLIEPDGWPEGLLSPAQDSALEELTRDLAEITRRSDRVARLDDARVAVLLVDCNRQGALVYADRLHLAADPFATTSGHTVSCGIAPWSDGMKTHRDLLTAAAAALRAAHAAGGDTMELHEPG